MENSRGGMSKLREKRGFLKKFMQKKNRIIPGGHDKIDWKYSGSTSKKIDILNMVQSHFKEIFTL